MPFAKTTKREPGYIAIRDLDYEKARNALIPVASLLADNLTPGATDEAAYLPRWRRNFMVQMQKLAVAAGLSIDIPVQY